MQLSRRQPDTAEQGLSRGVWAHLAEKGQLLPHLTDLGLLAADAPQLLQYLHRHLVLQQSEMTFKNDLFR